VRIAVFCGSSSRIPERYHADARGVGAAIAARGHVLVYGGGRTGLMGSVADAALAGGGIVQGVILREFVEQDVHHPGIAELHCVEDMRSRKAGLDERADAFIALPGGLGTLEEVAEILSFRKLGHHRRPMVLLSTASYFDPLLALIERAISDGFERPDARAYLQVARDAQAAVALCEAPPPAGGAAADP
jgi:uncharacterized protein (TIGR00730 family)